MGQTASRISLRSSSHAISLRFSRSPSADCLAIRASIPLIRGRSFQFFRVILIGVVDAVADLAQCLIPFAAGTARASAIQAMVPTIGGELTRSACTIPTRSSAALRRSHAHQMVCRS
jgi:hypothetical protein